MPVITIQSPLDQPSGTFRLLDEIKTNLQNPDFHTFKFISAFSKAGPYLRLKPVFDTWKNQGKTLSAILGIDQNGTSKQALEFIIANFNQSYIASVGNGSFKPTFHPKIYLFEGATRNIAYLGSNNMTVGGTETNSESLIKLDMDTSADAALLIQIQKCWNDALSISLSLDHLLLNKLVADKLVLDEIQMKKVQVPGSGSVVSAPKTTFPQFSVKPASPLPKSVLPKSSTPGSTSITPSVLSNGTQALVIQITPHHNGEVFLSKIAVNQNPDFFGFPFSGSTVPKKSSNASYPQRIPDPVVNIKTFDVAGNVTSSFSNFNLNTVYYSIKSEIRITVPQQVVANVPAFSIMVMSKSPILTVDYDINIYVPGSKDFQQYLASCNYDMPSGGKATSRKFGWI